MRKILVSLCVLAVVSALAPRADACIALGRHGPIAIRGEEALIVWEPSTRKEHFVRTAGFDAQNEDFGFLVPTPARPELAEVDDEVFARLWAIYRQPVRSRSRSAAPSDGNHAAAAQAPVEVLERRSVA